MDTVGLRELKARLSHYVERARSGQRVLVTDRGKPVAELIALSPERLQLLELARAGKFDWNGEPPKPLPRRGFVLRGEPLSKTIIDGRG
jgi:prevent-host-death family protein